MQEPGETSSKLKEIEDKKACRLCWRLWSALVKPRRERGLDCSGCEKLGNKYTPMNFKDHGIVRRVFCESFFLRVGFVASQVCCESGFCASRVLRVGFLRVGFVASRIFASRFVL